MHMTNSPLTVFIVLSVLLFILLGIVMVILIDHKSKIPGDFQHNPFGISGMRREHPVISFITTFILAAIIISLLLELTVVLSEHLGLFRTEDEKPEILKNIKYQRYSESQRHFHNVPDENRVDMGKKVVCFQCHGDYPHSKKPMIRTLLNMHTQFLGCMTCHIDPEKISEKNYAFRWLNYSGIKVKGPHFGTSINPQTGQLIETDDFYSKIVVYSRESTREKLLEMTEEHSDTKDFLRLKNTLTDDEKQAMKKSFHLLIMPKGRFCSRCHTEENKSYLPFRSLGFSDQRIESVTNLNIVGIVEKYRKFYMPDLFNHSSEDADTDTIETTEKKHNSTVPDQKLKKIRAWWRRSDANKTTDNK